jgi:hypothetical protein
VFFLLLLLFSGCLIQKDVASAQKETLVSSEEVDIDGDGAWDYATYTFRPVKIEEENIQLQRHLFVSVNNDISFLSFNDLTDYNVSEAAKEFESFVVEREVKTKECSSSLGLVSAICVDPKTCAKLCASASSKCSDIARKHENVLGDSIKSFVKNNDEISNLIFKSRKDFLTFKSDPETKKIELANKLVRITAHVASINAALIASHPSIRLCERSNYGVNRFKNILDMLGTYSKTPASYSYLSVITIKVINNETKSWQYRTLTLHDSLIKSDINAEEISSPYLDTQYKALSINATTSNISFVWDSINPYQNGELILVYGFSSKNKPATFLSALTTPVIAVKTLDLSILLPIMSIYEITQNISKNPAFALGFSLAITLIILSLIYNAAVISYHIISAITAGEKWRRGIYRAIMRTRLHWKSDLILAIILLAIGFGAIFYFATPLPPMTLFETFDYLMHLTDYFSFLGSLAIFFGFFILYLAAENKVKIYFLEKEYGRKIKEEKDLFMANITQLKTKLAELKSTADMLAEEGINVSREYEIIDNYPPERIEELAKKIDPYSKQFVEHSLFEIEGALQRLLEKKHLITENWPKWRETISSMLNESDEVHTNALVAIPHSLRAWALTKYLKEHSAAGLVYEGETLRRKSLRPERVIKDMISKGLLEGAVLVKNGKVLLVEVKKGSSTVVGILTLKLINYTMSTVKNLGQHTFSTIAAVGERLVIVLIRHQLIDTLFFVEKEKFKDAIEEWNAKLKLIEK